MTNSLRLFFTIIVCTSLGAPPARGEVRASISPAFQDLLKKVVDTASGTESIDGNEKVRAILVPELERLGFTTHVFLADGRKTLAFDFEGQQPRVLLVGHTDTVFAATSEFRAMTVDGAQIRGPGVVDMKGGLVLMLNALAKLKESSPEALKKIRVVINDDEETGSISSQSEIVRLGKGIPYGLVYEPGLPDGSLVSSLSGSLKIDLIVRGQAAHAGLEHEKGVNACADLGDKIAKLSRLTDYSKRLTVSVGTIHGGSKRNVVCDEATAQIDARFVDPKDRDAMLAKLRKIAGATAVKNPAGVKTTTEVKLAGGRPSVPEKSSRELMTVARRVGAKLGQVIRGAHVGYVCDANELAEAGMSVLAGLGPYGGGMHTEHEFMEAASYDRRLELSVRLIQELVGETAR